MTFKEDLERINRELDVVDTSLVRIKELSEEASRLFPVESKNLSVEETDIINSISKKSTEKVLIFAKKWQDGKIEISEEELKIMEEFHKNLTNLSKSLRDIYINSKPTGEKQRKMYQYIEFIMTNVKAIDKLIKEEKSRRQNNKDKEEGNHHSPSSNNSELDKQIASLQSKVQVLENKKKQIPTSDNSNDIQQQRREIEEQIQQLKNELKEKEKEKEKEKGRNTQQGSNFPWKPIFIVGGGIVLILVIILLIKKIIKN